MLSSVEESMIAPYSTRHTEARSPVEVKCKNPWNKIKKNLKIKKKSREGGRDLKPRKRRKGGEPRETLRY